MYWFGEDRQGENRVSCYRSSNLVDWEFQGNVLTLNSPFQPINMMTDPTLKTNNEMEKGAIIERPKVIYNRRDNKYVMWMHWENDENYEAGRCAVATCDTVDGVYVYHGSFNPIGHQSRDCTLFIDDDGTAYFISSARENADLHIYRLSEDYLSIDEHVKTLWPGQLREAPILMKREGVYFLLTSGCTGWEPNQGKYAYSSNIDGNWSQLHDFGGSTTFDTQPMFILPVQGSEKTTYLYIGDRWDPSDYHSSSYAILPLSFPTNCTLELHWADLVEVRLDSGNVVTERGDRTMVRIRNGFNRYLSTKSEGKERVCTQILSYSSPSLSWIIEPDFAGYIRIKNRSTNLFLEALETSEEVIMADRSDDKWQQWKLIDGGKGRRIIRNRGNEQVLTLNSKEQSYLYTSQYDPFLQSESHFHAWNGAHNQLFLITEHYG